MEAFNKITTSSLPQTNGKNGQLTTITPSSKLERVSKQGAIEEYRDAVLLIVEDSFQLSSQNSTLAERLARTDVWARVLIDIVPEARLQDSFDRAFREHNSSFSINAYDIKIAWEKIKTEENEAKIKTQAVECPGEKYHVNLDKDNFLVILMNPHTQLDELYPCPKCRMEDFENKKKTDIALYGEIKPMIILEKMVEAEKPKVEAETFSLEEIALLEIEHNSLVKKIAGAGAKDLLIEWNPGADCFTRRKYKAQTFSVSTVRKMIEDYRKL